MEAPTGPDQTGTYEDFIRRFPDNESCVHRFISWRWPRWPRGYRCMRCEEIHARGWFIPARNIIQCSACNDQVSLLKHTRLYGTNLPLHTWFHAAHLLCSNTERQSASALASRLGVTYKTGWHVLATLHEAIALALKTTPLVGTYHFGRCIRFPGSDFTIGMVATASSGRKANQVRAFLGMNCRDLEDSMVKGKRHGYHRPKHFLSDDPDYNKDNNIHVHDGNPPVIADALNSLVAWMPANLRNPRHFQRYLDEFCWVRSRGDDVEASVRRLVLAFVLPPQAH